ncbi:MAG: hypothetical protein LBG49_00465 [Mycoplasmataceae bacterium]|jgi:endoglucanase Acf2|nr:hypothetical protein [Mycoplasmataceae bacterium]
MARYKIVKCPNNEQLVGTEFESVIIKSMTVLNLVKKIASDVADIKTRLERVESRLDNLVKKNNLVE